MGEPEALARLTTYLQNLRHLPKTPPRALLAISAHWEEPVPTVMTSAAPPMLYDYSGFPENTYHLLWPAKGSPELAAQVQSLLDTAGIKNAANATRGFDHGTFVPFMLTYPQAEIPTVQLSLVRGLDPAVHLAIGHALAPLRDEGVFILGSGSSYHNMRGFGGRGHADSVAFDAWLKETTALPALARDARLVAWATAPGARESHPREEHLLPLMVVAGAAGADLGHVAYEDTVMGIKMSAHHFG